MGELFFSPSCFTTDVLISLIGMHTEGSGWEIQIARSASGSNAKSFEISSPVKSKCFSIGASLQLPSSL